MLRTTRPLLVALVVLASCGSDTNSAPPKPENPTAEAEQVVRKLIQAQVDGDQQQICRLFTERNLEERGGRAACDAAPTEVLSQGGATVLVDRTTATADSASVVVDFGKGRNARKSIPIVYSLKRDGGSFKIDAAELVGLGE